MVVDHDEVFSAFAAAASGLALPGIQLETVCASSGIETLQAAERSCPDVVVLDDDMPLLEGAETLSYLRALPGGFGAQLVVVRSALRQLLRGRSAILSVSARSSRQAPAASTPAGSAGVAARNAGGVYGASSAAAGAAAPPTRTNARARITQPS